MSLWSAFCDWRRRKHQLRVLRRLAKLDAEIESNGMKLANLRKYADRFSNLHQVETLGTLVGRDAYLRRIRAHNFQHEDVL